MTEHIIIYLIMGSELRRGIGTSRGARGAVERLVFYSDSRQTCDGDGEGGEDGGAWGQEKSEIVTRTKKHEKDPTPYGK